MATAATRADFGHAADLLAAELPLAAMERLAACGAIARVREDGPGLLWVARATAQGYAALEQPGRGLQALSEVADGTGAAAAPAALRLAAAETRARLLLLVRQPESALATAASALESSDPDATGPGPTSAAALRVPSLAQSLGWLWLHRSEAEGACDRWPAAAAAASEAAAAMRRLKDDTGVAAALRAMGRAAAALGQTDDADRHLTAALRRDEAGGRPLAAARDHTALAGLAQGRGQVAAAMTHCSAALDLLWSRVGRLDRWDVAHVCRLFGTILTGTADHRLAIQYLSRAAAYYGQAGDQEAAAAASAALDDLLREPPAAVGGPGEASLPEELHARVRALTTMLGLLDDLASTDPNLERHAAVVTTYALRLAAAMRISAERSSALVHACRLYHIGESAAGEGHAHPVLGAQLLRAFPLPEETLMAVRYFRERWDGGGYPEGLTASEIPELARLLAVVDGYVSLALDPAEPLPHSGALALVRARAGTAYDPGVVEAFARLHDAVGGPG